MNTWKLGAPTGTSQRHKVLGPDHSLIFFSKKENLGFGSLMCSALQTVQTQPLFFQVTLQGLLMSRHCNISLELFCP